MTYKTFSSAQEIFDYVTPLLFAQGQRSMYPDVNGEPTCAYRGGEAGELRCAIGFIIPDELYTPALESECVFNPAVKSVLKDIIPMGICQFLADLQDVHDGWICDGVDGNTASFNLYNDLLGLADGHELDETVLYAFNPNNTQ
jgi:hypothetical protein